MGIRYTSDCQERKQLFSFPDRNQIMNEGWACLWHYKILNKLELPQNLYLEFLKRHNQVVKPHEGGLNPYHLGFTIFLDLEKRYGLDYLFLVREQERDSSLIRRFLTKELCKELNLFEFSKNRRDYIITEIADKEGWKKFVITLPIT